MAFKWQNTDLYQIWLAIEGNVNIANTISTVRTNSFDTDERVDPFEYEAGDIVSNSVTSGQPLQIADIFDQVSAYGYITKLKLVSNKTNLTARFRIHILTTQDAINDRNDGDPFAPTYGELSSLSYLGAIDMPAFTTQGTAAMSLSGDIREAVKSIAEDPEDAGKDLYFLIETLDAFTDTTGFTVSLTAFTDLNA